MKLLNLILVKTHNNKQMDLSILMFSYPWKKANKNRDKDYNKYIYNKTFKHHIPGIFELLLNEAFNLDLTKRPNIAQLIGIFKGSLSIRNNLYFFVKLNDFTD